MFSYVSTLGEYISTERYFLKTNYSSNHKGLSSSIKKRVTIGIKMIKHLNPFENFDDNKSLD